MELWIGAINLGFLYAFMAMGVFITFRIHDFPDITVDGSFTAGAAVTAVLLVAGFNPLLAVIASFFIGAISGCMTALIHTRFNINGLLSGILVMTGLYSINLHIMGRSNIPLLNTVNVFSYIKEINPGLPDEIWFCLIFAVVIVLFSIMISIFFKTDLGITMRATGNNPVMAGALGVNVNAMKTFGISLANGLVGISGSIVAQYQGFADIGMGIGAIVFSLASVIIGESILKMRSIYAKFLSVIIGSVIFRLMVALALYAGLNPIDLKLITAIFVLIVLVAPKIVSRKSSKFTKPAGKIFSFVTGKRFIVGLCIIILIAGIAIFGYKGLKSLTSAPGKGIRIGVVQPKATIIHDDLKKGASPRKLALFLFSNHKVLDIVADGVIDELKRSGVLDKHNITVDIKNAQNDFGMAHSVVQDIIRQRYDYIVTLSTPALQVTANANKKIPHIFGFVTDPFRLGIAKDPYHHQDNITGVATFEPVESTIKAMRELFPKAKRIGIIWNPAEECSEACTYRARDVAKKYHFELLEATVSNTVEIKDALMSLLNKKIDIFFNSGDNTVNLSVETIAEILKKYKIPYFTNSPEDIERGAFVSIGTDFYEIGIETGKMAQRVINGEQPKNIPIKDFIPEKIVVNTSLAKLYGIKIPEEFLKKAAIIKR